MAADSGILPFRFTPLHNGRVDDLRGAFDGRFGTGLSRPESATGYIRSRGVDCHGEDSSRDGPGRPEHCDRAGSTNLYEPAGNDFYRLDQHARAEVRRGVA